MALPAPNDGLDVIYQGYPCSPDYQFELTADLEPSRGYVRIPRELLGELVVRPGLVGVDCLSPPSPGGPGLLSVGALEVTERIDGKVVARTVFERVFVDETSMQEDMLTENDSSLVTVYLASQELLWEQRGTLAAWCNVLKEGYGYRPQRRGTRTDDEEGLEEIDVAAFIVGSLDVHEPYTAERVLLRWILPALPGQPALARPPESAPLGKMRPYGLVWPAGTRPKRALGELMRQLDLVYCPRPDGTVAFYLQGQGAPRLEDGRPLPFALATSLRSYSHRYVAPIVQVLGPPIIEEVLVSELEPVGELGGLIVPLEEALKAHGLALSDAARIVLDPEGDRWKGLSPESEAEVRRWAWKWFRLPGGPREVADLLPMLQVPSGTRIAGGEQVLEPIRVFAETWTIGNLARILVADDGREQATQPRQQSVTDPAPPTDDTIDTFVRGLRAISAKLPSEASIRGGAAFQIALLGPLGGALLRCGPASIANAIDQVRGIDISRGHGSRPVEVTGRVKERIEELKAAAAELGVQDIDKITPEQLRRVYELAQKKKLRDARAAGIRGVYNVPFGEVSASTDIAADFEVDDRRGLVKFPAPIGHVKEEGLAPGDCELIPWPRVDVIFGRAAKPRHVHLLSAVYRYESVWALDDGGNIQHLDQVPKGAAPVVLIRPDLQMVRRVNGEENRTALDAVARQEAALYLTRPKGIRGARIKLERPLPAVTTGMVTSVRWDGEPGRAELHAGHYAADRPRPRLRTIAEDEAASAGGPGVPRGLFR